MAQFSESKNIENERSNDSNVIHLGFNISVAGNPASDFEIYVNDKKQSCNPLSDANLLQIMSSENFSGNQNIESNSNLKESTAENLSDFEEWNKNEIEVDEKKSLTSPCDENKEVSKITRNEDLSIVNEIENVMDNFEKFSAHLREIPRLFTKKKHTSTPYRGGANSRSEGNFSTFGFKPRSYIPRYDFRDGKSFKKAKSLSNDLFLKPLPGEGYFRKRTTRRHYDIESYRYYTSFDSLSNCYEYENELMDVEKKISKSENEITDALFSAPINYIRESKLSENPRKKEDGEVTDKQSSSPESAKDIKIYQSGGIIIMQNFNDMDLIDKKNLGASSKSLESDRKPKEKKEDSLQSSDDSQKLLLNSSSDETKGQTGKSVQFDLSSCENTRSKSCDSWSEIQKNEPIGCLGMSSKSKDSALLGSQNQDLSSLSIQENDSVISNMLGMSPSSSTSGKKLEWDSGADVGYLNLNISKENLSTIERIILKGLNGDEKLEKNLSTSNLPKAPSETIFEEINTREIESSLEKNNGSANNIENQQKESVSTKEVHANYDATNFKKRDKQENLMIKSVFEDGISKTKTTTKTFKMTGKNIKKLLSTYDNLKKEKEHENIQSIDQNSTEINNAFSKSNRLEVENNHSQPLLNKSTYVNTLFGDFCSELPIKNVSKSEESGISESSDKHKNVQSVSPRIKKLKKKKKEKYLQGVILPARMKDKINTIIDIAKYSRKPENKSKVLHKKSEDKVMQETTANCEKEAITVDEKYQHEEKTKFISEKNFRTKERISVKLKEKSKVLQENFVHAPKSSSSSPIQAKITGDKIDNSSEVTDNVKTYSDQIVQTTEMKYESKSILAFESLRYNTASIQVGDKGCAKNITEGMQDFDEVEISGKNKDNKLIWSCSKSIQVPVINSSLPKHLAHPKETTYPEQQNTKSTQFFGCAVTSLPNFHSAMTTKEVEKEKNKVLKNKVNSVSQNSRTQQENYKNTVIKKTHTISDKNRAPTIESIDYMDDSSNLKSFNEDSNEYYKKSHKGIEKRKTDSEDKENFSEDKKAEEFTDGSKRKNNCSYKDFDENTWKKNESKKSDSLIFGSCDVQLSDDGKKVVLTSELLKEHGDIIDRNIIQEKYFQSQLLELDKREIVTRGTSMERKMEFERNTQTDLSLKREVGCQYSPHFIKGTDKTDSQKKSEMKSGWKEEVEGSTVEWQLQEEESVDEISRNNSQLKISEILTSDRDLGLTDSLSNSSQTAHSWIPGFQRNSENQDFIIGKALSFEYLPGHLYEYENFRMNSIGDMERNMNSGDSFQSNQPNPSLHLNNEIEESESKNTIVLENSDRTLPDSSDQIKALDNNLTELETVVSRLHEKDALFQKITNSMLQSVTKKKTPEISCYSKVEDIKLAETKEMSCEVKFVEETDNSNGSKPEIKVKEQCLNDISTACQTDTMTSESKKFHDDRKQLEEKVNEEKKQQIKWIENEINHLNMLRSLLEKHEDLGSMVHRKKRHHYLTETNKEISVVDTLRENILRTILGDSLPQVPASAENPVLKKSLKLKAKSSLDLSENSAAEFKELSKLSTSAPNYAHFGTSLSLNRIKNLPQITTLPVGVHVTLQDMKIKKNRSSSRASSDSPLKSSERCCKSNRSSAIEHNNATKEIGISYHNLNDGANSVAYINMLKHSESLCKCVKCTESKCDCLKTEQRIRNKSSRNFAQNNEECEMNSTKPIGLNSLSVSEGSNKSSIRETDRDKLAFKEASASESFKSDIINSKDSSKCDQSHLSSEASNNFEKCQCNCHAEPLPRCDSCNLLNTCKKCQCYRRIKCCLCKKSVPFCSVKKKCVDVASTCICSVSVSDFDCKMGDCRYSNLETQICAVCSCHMKSSNIHHRRDPICTCKKRYEERSSQTEKKACTCCKCKNHTISDSYGYRETKYMSEKKQRTETQKPSKILSPSENKCVTEIKQGMEEKFPYQIKAPLEKRNSIEDKNSNQIKNEIEKRYPSKFVTSEIKKFEQTIPCHCKNRREKSKDMDEHPRHYFLQIEETSEESSEPSDNKDSLKVITITVPIRKVCKEDKKQSLFHQRNSQMGERSTNDGDVLSARSNLQRSLPQSNQCNCCSECKGHRPNVVSQRPKTANDSYMLDSGQIENRRKYSISFKDENRNKCSCYEDDSECRRLNLTNFQPISSSWQKNFSDDEHLRKDFRSKPKIVSTKSALELADLEINYKLYKDCKDCIYHNANSYGEFTRNQYQSKSGKREVSDECICCNCAKADENNELTHYSSPSSTSSQSDSRNLEMSGREYMSSLTHSRESFDNKLPDTCKDKNAGSHQIKSNEKVESETEKDGTNAKKCKNEKKTSSPKSRKISPANQICRPHPGPKLKSAKSGHLYKLKDIEYHNFNKREYMTKSELEREEKKKRPERLTLQECLTIKRPDLYTRAECRRKIIQEKSRERAERHSKRMECLNKIISQCNISGNNSDLKLFTTAQMKKQTKKFYKRLPEVTNKLAEEKKKAQFRTNKLLAEVFAKKLQLQTLKGCMNLSNSFSVLTTS